MVPERSGDDPTDGDPVAENPQSVVMDEDVLYSVVRGAVEDAILSAVGKIILAGFGLVLAWTAIVVPLGGDGVTGLTASTILVVVGVFLAARVLNLVPPLREWGE